MINTTTGKKPLNRPKKKNKPKSQRATSWTNWGKSSVKSPNRKPNKARKINQKTNRTVNNRANPKNKGSPKPANPVISKAVKWKAKNRS